MPEFKLIYFNRRGRAELIRWIFAYGGINYTDERVENKDWPERKKTIFGGKLPVLIIDGERTLPQSLAIARYIATLVGLRPEDPHDAAFSDSVVETLSEMTWEGYKIMTSELSEEEKTKKYREDFFPNIMQDILERLQHRLSQRTWFVAEKVTWADLMIALVFGEVEKRKAELLAPYPAVTNIVHKVREMPAIKAWIESAPDTPL